MTDYIYPFGLWKVTTEGDCEGRSTRDLGTYEGFIDEIAFYLASESYYALTFKKLEPRPEVLNPTRKNVIVKLNIDSETWDMSNDERVGFFNKMLRHREGVYVKKSSIFASVELSFDKETEEEKMEKNIKSKLTEEELRFLNLKEK